MGAATMLLAGCVTTPEFDHRSGVSPTSVVQVVECELIAAKARYERLRYRPDKRGSEYWVAVADLTLQVDESATLTPSFTHTDVVSTTLTRVFNWGVKVDTQAQRIYNQSVTFTLSQLRPNPACDDVGGFDFSLNGDLGISEVVGMAFHATQRAPGYPGVAFTAGGKNNAFGESVQFVVTKNVNGLGPTWILSFFKGPGGLLQMQRGDTHKLVISFAPASAPGGAAKAAEAAKANNYLLLQQNLPTSIINELNRQ